jgi:uncharacterized protein with HEPN domain
MSRHEREAILEDSLQQIDDLLEKAASISLEQFLNDRNSQAIFERRLEILGEAMRRLERRDPECFARIPGARESIGLRNVISHGYDGIDHRILYSIVRNALPTTRSAILQELGRSTERG